MNQETAQQQKLAVPRVLDSDARRPSDSPSAPENAQLMNPLAVDAGNYVSDSSGRPGKFLGCACFNG